MSDHALEVSGHEESSMGLLVTAPRIHRRRRESGGSTESDTSVPPEMGRFRSSSNTSIASEPVGQGSVDAVRPGQSIRRTASDRQLRRSGSERALRKHSGSGTLRRFGSGDIPTGKDLLVIISVSSFTCV